jgi:hypothetical protein
LGVARREITGEVFCSVSCASAKGLASGESPGTIGSRAYWLPDTITFGPAVRAKVDEIVAQSSEEDIQSLRKSIDATPAAASALKAKGLSSAQVVAINIADGVLTLFTNTA